MSKGRILVVDDEPGIVDIAEANLEGHGYCVLAAYNGEEALQKIRLEKPDLVVLDVLLPGMDGWEVLEQIEADPELSGIPVIMLTALARNEHALRGLETGAVEYMTKPFYPEDLVAAVKINLEVFDHQLRQQRRRLLAEQRRRIMLARGLAERA